MGEQQLDSWVSALSPSAPPPEIPDPTMLKTPDLAEVARGAPRAALGLGLSAHVVIAEHARTVPPL